MRVHFRIANEKGKSRTFIVSKTPPRQEWNLHFSSTQYEKIKHFTLGDIIFITVEKTGLVYLFMVQTDSDTLLLLNYGLLGNNVLTSLQIIWKLPLNFFNNVRLPDDNKIFQTWLMEKPRNCEIVKRLTFDFHGLVVVLVIFVYENISYGVIVSHFNQTNLFAIAVRHPLPDYWRIAFLCVEALLRFYNLSSDRILVEDGFFRKWNKKMKKSA